MFGTVNIKFKSLIELAGKNLLIFTLAILPLLLHYASSSALINLKFNLNHYLIGRDVYLIMLSIYLGYLALEVIKIFRKPNIKWEIKNYPGQVLLKITNSGDLLNKIFGQEVLETLLTLVNINEKTWSGRWQSNPEPLQLGIDKDGNFIDMPNYALMGFNKKNTIIQSLFDNLVLLWKIDGEKNIEYYIVDEYKYHPSLRKDENNKIELPNKTQILIFTNEDVYEINIELETKL